MKALKMKENELNEEDKTGCRVEAVRGVSLQIHEEVLLFCWFPYIQWEKPIALNNNVHSHNWSSSTAIGRNDQQRSQDQYLGLDRGCCCTSLCGREDLYSYPVDSQHGMGRLDYNTRNGECILPPKQSTTNSFCIPTLDQSLSLSNAAVNSIQVHYGAGQDFIYLSPHEKIMALKTEYISLPACTFCGCFAKISVALLLKRIMNRDKRREFWLWFIIISVFIVNALLTAVTFLQCIPVEKNWNPSVRGACWNQSVHRAVAYFQGGRSSELVSNCRDSLAYLCSILDFHGHCIGAFSDPHFVQDSDETHNQTLARFSHVSGHHVRGFLLQKSWLNRY